MGIVYHQNGFACSCGYQKLIHAEDKDKRLYKTYKRLHKKTGCTGKELDTGSVNHRGNYKTNKMKETMINVRQPRTQDVCVEIN
tara:strand:+ start:200 stop:451 length:252 start_codon:yes stop_codon:yes gene_type:complete